MSTSQEQVILVNEFDEPQGLMEKEEAHLQGRLHRAISVLVIKRTPHGWEALLQQRASHKYHSANLWTNTACTHPREKESIETAAKRRLMEEMGVSCDLTYITSFIYREELDNNMIEHELDHVFIGMTDNPDFLPNPTEVKKGKWLSLEFIQRELHSNPDKYTAWFPAVFITVLDYIKTLNHDSQRH